MKKILFFICLIFVVSCSVFKPKPVASLYNAVVFEVPTITPDISEALNNPTEERLSDLYGVYGVSGESYIKEAPKVPKESWWNGCVIIDPEEYITNEELKNIPHIKFRTVGEYEEWVPINGISKKYLVFKIEN